MDISLCGNYIKITIDRENIFLDKIVNYAKKHFSHNYQLSSSVLILDDGERIKKDYFINWVYHLCEGVENREPDSDLKKNGLTIDELLSRSDFPIRIKIVTSNSILQRVKITLKSEGISHSSLVLDTPNRVAKRYLLSYFERFVIGSSDKEIFLDSSESDFWNLIIDIVSNKVIHNVFLDFDFKSFKNSENQMFFDTLS